MSAPKALVATAGCLLLAATVLGLCASDSRSGSTAYRLTALGWTTFALSMLAFAGAAWWEALS